MTDPQSHNSVGVQTPDEFGSGVQTPDEIKREEDESRLTDKEESCLSRILNRIAKCIRVNDEESRKELKNLTVIDYNKIQKEWRDDTTKAIKSHVTGPDGDDAIKTSYRVGKHEWIPTSIFQDVVNFAVALKDVRWLIAMELLRTPTQHVIFRGIVPSGKESVLTWPDDDNPEALGKRWAKKHFKAYKYANLEELSAPPALSKLVSLQGHTAALYKQTRTAGGGGQTEGMGPWHDQLRAIFHRNLNPEQKKNDLTGFTRDLAMLIGVSVWNGSLEQLANYDKKMTRYFTENQEGIKCDYWKKSAFTKENMWAKNLKEMAETQAKGYKEMNDVLLNHFKALASMEPPKDTEGFKANAFEVLTGAKLQVVGFPENDEAPEDEPVLTGKKRKTPDPVDSETDRNEKKKQKKTL